MRNIQFFLALHQLAGVGDVRLKALLDRLKDPRKIWEASIKDWQGLSIPGNVIDNWLEVRRNFNVDSYYKKITDAGIKIKTIYDADYPEILSEIYDPPVIIYYKGEFPLPGLHIGVVGTRNITGYGRVITEKFTKHVAQKGLVVVSGLARGVDTVAHQTTVDNQGKTIAVLGGGLNNIFPSENQQLADRIARGSGAVISEFPPGYEPTPGNFPARNRVISGLSKAVLVTEAALDSGSLITAKEALDQGREVFAIPGPITSYTSGGTSVLLKQGAHLVTEPEEILEVLGVRGVSAGRQDIADTSSLSDKEKQVLGCLESEVKHLDEICRELKLSSPEVSAMLIKMEIKGLVNSMGGGNYIKSF